MIVGQVVPMVLESDGRYERSFDIYSRLLRERIVFLGQEVDDNIANLVAAQLLFLEAEDTEKDIYLPAWNEAGSLPAVLSELKQELPEADVLVVDDGSTDGTAEVARAGGAEVLSFPANRGLREAIAAGWGYAHERGYWFCGRVDA